MSAKPEDSKADLSLILRHRQVPQGEKDFLSALYENKNENAVGTLRPKDGVTFIQGGYKLKGPRYSSASVDPSFLGRIAEADAKTERLTVKQYEKKVKRSGMRGYTELTTENYDPEDRDKVPEVTSKKREDDSSILNVSHAQKPNRQTPVRLRVLEKSSSVKVHSSNLLKTFIQPEQQVNNILRGIETERVRETESDAVVVERPIRQSSVDEFNIKILNSESWGANPSTKKVVQPYAFPKMHQQQLRWSLGVKARYPRERPILPSGSFHQQSSINSSMSSKPGKATGNSPMTSFFN